MTDNSSKYESNVYNLLNLLYTSRGELKKLASADQIVTVYTDINECLDKFNDGTIELPAKS